MPSTRATLSSLTRRPSKNRVAVIGSGISGLSAAWLLSRTAEVTLFEADSRVGGHANTVDITIDGENIAVDTGFIVYNEGNYPNLVALFKALDVPTIDSDMSFAASLDGGAFEYAGHSLSGLLGQKRNAFNFRFWQMLGDLVRFYKDAPAVLNSERDSTQKMTLGEYLDARGYSRSFIDNHILPMGAAIWSTTAAQMRSYPLVAFIRFFESHGLLKLLDKPMWRTVNGGSREYVRRLIADFTSHGGQVRLNTPVQAITRTSAGVSVRYDHDGFERFDDVVIATHADQALRILTNPTEEDSALLGAFKYTPNRAVLHSDPDLMPRRRAVWASWNYMGALRSQDDRNLSVSYWMNRLQPLNTRTNLFVTLNPHQPVNEPLVYAQFDYTHPLFDDEALQAQKNLWRIQGNGGVWFCGAHCGSGFHEDGLQSGLAIAERIGGMKRPWTVANESARIYLPDIAGAAQ
ncbi:MAG: FAD-dependent oxidoreductase [Asticcacaulis sp.]